MENRIRELVIPIILILVGVGVILMGILPGIDSIKKARADLEAAKKKQSVLQTKANVLNSMDEASTRSLLTIASNALPSEKNVPGLLAGLERMAQEASASIQDFSIAPGMLATEAAAPPPTIDKTPAQPTFFVSQNKEKDYGAGVSAIPFMATLKGNYLALHDFLAGIYKVNRLLGADSIVFKVNERPATKGQQDISSDLVLLVYYQPEVSSVGKSDMPLELLTEKEKTLIQSMSANPVVTNPPELVPTGKVNPFNP